LCETLNLLRVKNYSIAQLFADHNTQQWKVLKITFKKQVEVETLIIETRRWHIYICWYIYINIYIYIYVCVCVMYIPKGNSTVIIMRDCSDFIRYKTLEKPLSKRGTEGGYNNIDPFFRGLGAATPPPRDSWGIGKMKTKVIRHA